ncbi:MAG: UDP-N-acetylmuramate--L-alanine ligase [Ignavibacteria bacterium]|nr:UDP-N-acetylmuramate--L-alanine ligase [Ignavibacteria bacterium]
MLFQNIQKIHFIGIGGIGMSGIAEILLNKDFTISGSDMARSENTEHLESLGATIYYGHSANNIAASNADVVVYSSAVHIDTNPEVLEANRRKIPVIRRAEMLAEISRLNYCIAVSGTHGKTTTTSMLALMLIAAGIDPTVVVGGRLKDLGGTNARLGHSQWSLVEADEYDRSFLQLLPTIAVINNIEAEHLDIYKDVADLQNTFAQFANMTPFYGFIATGIDDEGVQNVIPMLRKKVITFGLDNAADYTAKNIRFHNFTSTCEVYEYGQLLGEMTLNVPGEFNIKNALGAVLVARQFNVSFNLIAAVIERFHGAFRRFEIKGEVNDIIVIDDYAHHPSEIKATLKGLRNYADRRIIAVFQPHTYTRTKEFYKDFANSFADAALAFVTDVYPAREEPLPGITGQIIVDAAVEAGYKHFTYVPNRDALTEELRKILRPKDVVITLGAGNIYEVGERLLGDLSEL